MTCKDFFARVASANSEENVYMASALIRSALVSAGVKETALNEMDCVKVSEGRYEMADRVKGVDVVLDLSLVEEDGGFFGSPFFWFTIRREANTGFCYDEQIFGEADVKEDEKCFQRGVAAVNALYK